MPNASIRGVADSPRIDATGLAQFVRLESCERFLWYRLHPDETRGLFREYRATEQPLTPLLAAKGSAHEEMIEQDLGEKGVETIDLDGEPASRTTELLAGDRDGPLALLQPRLAGTIGPFEAAGIADLLEVSPAENGAINVEISDAKASRKDRPEHRIQVAFYSKLLRQMAAAAGVEIASLTGSIWRVPADDEDQQPVVFDLEPYEEAVELLVDGDAVVPRIAAAERADARYHLTYKCDGCPYNALCMREAAETEGLALVPFMNQRDRAALERHGVTTVSELADVKGIPARGDYSSPLPVAKEHAELVAALASEWPLGASLDLHVQRARAAARSRGADVESLSWIHGSGFGSLPDFEAHEGIVQVFVDAQHDYLQDRVHMIAGLVSGPEGEREVVQIADGPPDEECEAELVVGWVRELLLATREVAGADEAFVHVYVYDAYDQKVLLDALRRNLDHLAGIPDFFDLLTETSALSQNMFSFLAQEVRERKNLGILCHSLPAVARRLGFDWSFEGVDYWDVFRARVFDNRRTLAEDDWYESAARFNSQIPLEYAYGAWDRLPDDEESRELVAPFRVSPEQLVGFARARLHALRHVEQSFRFKSKYLDKVPVRLPDPEGESDYDPSLAEVLVEFLHLEHHAKLQAALLLFAHPVERRVASGQSLLVEALEDRAGGTCRLRLRFDEAGLDPVAATLQMGPEEGDWMVIGDADDAARPWSIVRGRIAVVQSISGDEITVELHDATFPRNTFRYWHENEFEVKAGQRYVLDPMVDDLVAERLLQACVNPDHNEFLDWIGAGGENLAKRRLPRGTKDAVAGFTLWLEESPEVLTPTARQSEVIGQRLRERILLVQGPPGTGKTHTIAWAILARAYAAAQRGDPFHVLVSSMTHTAVEVVLRSVVHKLEAIRSDATAKAVWDALSGLTLFKESWDPDQPVPDGVLALASTGLSDALAGDLVVIGSVPGGVHRLLKGGGAVDWSEKHFNLLVVDEASQFSLPAAVLAGASLRSDGQALIVGDHRQMPPILAHGWEHEPRRGVQDANVYRSTFEALRDRGFPVIGLDRSFRLHRMHADFLEEHVYAEDEVGFHSELDWLLEAVGGLEGHVEAALRPEYPVVVVEHTEARSMKRNDAEIAIVAPIIEAAVGALGLDGEDGVGVVVPHRAQRAALRDAFPDLAAANAIDTVERFQGGERDLIIISATASDPEFVLAEASFLLNPNRLNVAFSRPRRKLIVVGSTTIFRLMPPDMETFENALLWKRLRYEFSAENLWEGEIGGVGVRVSGRSA